MARFDIHVNRGRTNDVPFLLDVQADALSSLRTRVVIPLVPAPAFGTPLGRLHPVFQIENQPHVLATSELVSVDRQALGDHVGSLTEHHVEIVDAIDFLSQGF